HRLVGIDDRTVSFRWKDYADGNTSKVMTLDGVEFVRRFLQHVQPGGFVRIRHYGLLANRCRAAKLALCRNVLTGPPPAAPAQSPDADAPAAAPADPEGPESSPESTRRCPACGTGRMIVTEVM